jgi:hypothetical protein
MLITNGAVAFYFKLNTMTNNVWQISEGTNSVGIVRLDLGFCLCAVSRCGGLISINLI